MNVALVFARFDDLPSENDLRHEHIGLAYMATQLKKYNYSYDIIDAYVFEYSNDVVVDMLLTGKYDVVGFSVIYSNFENTREIYRKVHQKDKSVNIFLGGQHVSFCADELLKNNKELNSIIRGEGEITLIEYMAALEGINPLSDVLGITYRKDNKIITNEDRMPFQDLEDYGLPEHDSFKKSLQMNQCSSINILAGRGCLFKCSFCTGSKIFDPFGNYPWRVREAKNVVAEYKCLLDTYGDDENVYEIVHFCDLNFINESKRGLEWIDNFIDEMKGQKVESFFYILTRVDSIVNQRLRVSKLREVGLVQLEMGLEAGSKEGLEVFNKKTSINYNVEAVKFLREQRIDINTSGFIMYHPYSTISELRENAEFLLSIDYFKIMHLLNKMALYPGASITEEVTKDNLLYDSFEHHRVYDYRFKEDIVETIFNSFSSELDYDVLSMNSTNIMYIELQLILNYRKLEKIEIFSKEVLDSKIDFIEKKLTQLISKSKTRIYNFFIDVLNLAETDWKYEEFVIIKNIFTLDYMNLGKEITEGYRIYDEKFNGLLG